METNVETLDEEWRHSKRDDPPWNGDTGEVRECGDRSISCDLSQVRMTRKCVKMKTIARISRSFVSFLVRKIIVNADCDPANLAISIRCTEILP